MSPTPFDLPVIVAKAAVAHTVTYFVIGWLASTLLDYAGLFAEPGLGAYMRPISCRWPATCAACPRCCSRACCWR